MRREDRCRSIYPMRNQQYPRLSYFPLPVALKFHPPFPPSSTSKFRRPQVSHSSEAISDCEYFLDTRKCFHCRRERRAASDRARLVLRQFSRGACQGGSESLVGGPKGLRTASSNDLPK